MEALVETHNEKEIDLAIDSGAEIIGINNRNLKDLKIDLATTQKLSAKIPKGKLTVSESGIRTKEDLDYVLQYVDAALIGTFLMRSKDITKTIKGLLK